MNTLKIVECTGYTKQEAFADLGFDPACAAIHGCNATQAWEKEGKPMPGTTAFAQFISQQVALKTKNVPGLGVYVVLEPSISDTRKKPYTVINNKVEGVRDWKFVYWIREDEIDVSKLPVMDTDDDGELIKTDEQISVNVSYAGKIVCECDNKIEAFNKMKELTATTHKCYTALAVKVPNLMPIAGYCIYTPSSNAKKGIWIAAGIPA